MSELRMNAYYYNFDETGVPEIDKILSAVACAGKAYHHTNDWNKKSTWEGHTGNCPIEWIQNAANEAAIKFKGLKEGGEVKNRTQLILRAVQHNNYVWPHYLTSGIMFFEGEKIEIFEYNNLLEMLTTKEVPNIQPEGK